MRYALLCAVPPLIYKGAFQGANGPEKEGKPLLHLLPCPGSLPRVAAKSVTPPPGERFTIFGEGELHIPRIVGRLVGWFFHPFARESVSTEDSLYSPLVVGIFSFNLISPLSKGDFSKVAAPFS